MRYLCSVVEFVPTPARDERVNIGAIVGSDESGDWDFRLVSNFKRARAIDDTDALRGVRQILGEFEDQFFETLEEAELGEGPLPDEDWLGRLPEQYSNVIQFSEPIPIRADSAAQALDVVFKHLISDPSHVSLAFLTKRRALQATRRAYAQYEIPRQAVSERAVIRVGAFRTQVDFVVHNGRALQLAHTWSFQVPNAKEVEEQILAWAWVMREVRDGHGAATAMNGHEIGVDRDVSLGVVYVPPKSSAGNLAFAEARSAFDRVGRVTAVEVGDAAAVARDAAERLGHRLFTA